MLHEATWDVFVVEGDLQGAGEHQTGTLSRVSDLDDGVVLWEKVFFCRECREQCFIVAFGDARKERAGFHDGKGLFHNLYPRGGFQDQKKDYGNAVV